MSNERKKMWGGRFEDCKNDPLMDSFGESISFDQRLYEADIIASKAYCKAICKIGIITETECAQIIDGLETILTEWNSKTFVVKPDDEDIHSANERRLGELIGTISGKLHTGRSRNDQVATDLRLWLRIEATAILNHLTELISVVVRRAENEVDVIMPGYTHMQKAQPIRWSHFLLSNAWLWCKDVERLKQLIERINVLPLGCGAMAGHAFNIDRLFLAEELGFHEMAINSMTAVSDRDFVAEFLFWASLTMLHISRIAEDLIIYSSAEFGFVAVSDSYCTGSSLMPQKRNPDSLELLRGKCGRVFGSMTGFMMTYKGLPSSYNRDLQEDKEPLFDAVDTLSTSLQILAGVLRTLTIFPDKMRQSLSTDMLATDLADYLVRKDVPFREAHFICGLAVKLAAEKGLGLHELSINDLQTLHQSFGSDVVDVWNYEKSIELRSAVGGTSKSSVHFQIDQMKLLLDKTL
ncbi:hypothetical protein HA402_009688 [Bradysia odoriphaga]|nr:hypothetical protein HA402_009688 [Bradysia odoriphaga]